MKLINKKYRSGVGVMLINPEKEIYLFERADIKNSWQFPEGGVDEKENPKKAALREMEEEIGVPVKKVKVLSETKDFIPYVIPEDKRQYGYIGQKKKFFLVEFDGNRKDINFRKSEHVEFQNYKIIRKKEDLLQYIVDFKQEMYKKVLEEFSPFLKKKEKKIEKKQEGERIAKVIARSGYCSRREAERLIEEGAVKVNGKIIRTPAIKITDESIKINNKLLQTKEPTKLWVFHKPKGCLVSNQDIKNRKTIFDLLPAGMPRVVAVGRLDMNTEGLLLLTNNGELSRYISHPSTGWTRRYRVRVYGKLDMTRFEKLAQKGITIDGIKYAPMKVELDKERNFNSWLKISITEGKNREIKKILEYFGLTVNRLIRISFGPFHLGKLPSRSLKRVPKRVLKEVFGSKVELD